MKRINLYFHAIVIFSFTGLFLGNISLYRSWGTIINARAISFLSQPKEVFASISNIEWFISFLIWTAIFVLFFYLFRKYVQKFFPEPAEVKSGLALTVLACIALVFLGVRGGTQLIPINESSAYFSSKPLLNQMATNTAWYLGHSLLESRISNENPYHYYDDAVAENRLNSLYKSKADSVVKIFSIDPVEKPNIVIIILESWSADVVKALGGDDSITPNFNELKNDGILFSNIYSSGFRTDQGIVSILSGFPSQPNNSIIRHPSKTEKLPSLIREFKNIHYHTSFYYGGEIAFANMNTYLLNEGCDKLITEDDFKEAKLSTKWGIYDEYVLNRQAADLSNEGNPFLSILLTLNTHEPFDIPIKNPFGNETEPNKFRGAAYYTDLCLGNYFKKVKEEPWFQNTIFILLADHGHRLPREQNYEDPASRRMTMMFYGNLIKPEFKGKVFDMVAGQNDLAATILSQFGINRAQFKWSNDILNINRNNFAYISLDYGLNWVLPKTYFIIHFNTGNIDFPKGKENITDADIANAKSYIQCLYREFLDF